jgi:hypothetical protein
LGHPLVKTAQNPAAARKVLFTQRLDEMRPLLLLPLLLAAAAAKFTQVKLFLIPLSQLESSFFVTH